MESSTTDTPTISDSSVYEDIPHTMSKSYVENRYSLWHTLHDLEDVGLLTVKVHRATGLATIDFGGKCDPFCILELGNIKFQTKSKSKTLSPSWEEIFSFEIKDISSVLEITVFYEDYEKTDFVGKVLIPLLRIQNGEQKWYSLKDKNLITRAKGNTPMILLEMNIVWNPIRACIKSLSPKDNYLQDETKFKVPAFMKNVVRLKALVMSSIRWGKFIQGYCDWENPTHNAIALAAYIIVCYYFKPYMIPGILLTIFLKNYIVLQLGVPQRKSYYVEEYIADNEDELDDKEKEGRKSLRKRFHEIQEVTQGIQHVIGNIATLGEQVKNTFNFTVPFISYIAMGITFAGMLILYLIPLRYAMMSIGVLKFGKKLIRPDAPSNIEIKDLLSRVPDDEELLRYREFRTNLPIEIEERPKKNSEKTAIP